MNASFKKKLNPNLNKALLLTSIVFYTYSFGTIIRGSRLADLINYLADYTRNLATPFTHITVAFQEVLSHLTPPIEFTTNNSYIGLTKNCKLTDWVPLKFNCKLDLSSQTAGITEEIVHRGFLQNLILPVIALEMPVSIGKIFNHKITRVFFTSLIFAAGHLQLKDVSSQFIGGIVCGTLAETTGSLKIPMLVHVFHNCLCDLIGYLKYR